ncbi:hypothetical protein EV424DRAFT_210243 [Suillus variegatus]|nr:hypothetical protein EV424DRAFT_210243 [Suillus variegatus]
MWRNGSFVFPPSCFLLPRSILATTPLLDYALLSSHPPTTPFLAARVLPAEQCLNFSTRAGFGQSCIVSCVVPPALTASSTGSKRCFGSQNPAGFKPK